MTTAGTCANPWHASAPARARQTCAECQQVNDLDAWARTALDNGLRVITLFDTDLKPEELVIINDSDQPERDERALWIKPYRLIGWDGKGAQDLDPGEALALIARLKKPIKTIK